LYPLAAQQLSKKATPVASLPEMANPIEKAFRPSHLFIRNGKEGIKNAHKRYYKLPRAVRIFKEKAKPYKATKKFYNRVDNYMKSNESFRIQDVKLGTTFRPFVAQRVIQ